MDNIVDEIALAWGGYRPTPLLELPALAGEAALGRVFVKLESERPLGNFKSLGGMIAALRAVSRNLGLSGIQELLTLSPDPLPELVCASDGNHGLAVAAAARRIGTRATIYLPRDVSSMRAERIVDIGARIVRVDGTYDDAVCAAEHAGGSGAVLVADTSRDTTDPVISDVMSGYRLIAEEVCAQICGVQLTHVFAQAGVGGLAAALADGLQGLMAQQGRLVVVEPEGAACVGAGLAAGKPVRIAGDLRTSAEMLSCGMASAPALELLLRHQATALEVGEIELAQAIERLERAGGPKSTPSGAAGLAGLLVASRPERRALYGLKKASIVLVIATEAVIDVHSDLSGSGQWT